ncbi:hypothetical protein Xhom_03112 [Xenorhabdus hominickii]|uniref:Uncharacterized protein n=1 Tax=Xenorhabdus hominickii TaxID=351679 RepID=A0A2G0Q4B5_XENHO|nr:hypothetical protein Xhom_03112 [Xenorhabdus hominickii]
MQKPLNTYLVQFSDTGTDGWIYERLSGINHVNSQEAE